MRRVSLYCPSCGEASDVRVEDLHLAPDAGWRIKCPYCGTDWLVKVRMEEVEDEGAD